MGKKRKTEHSYEVVVEEFREPASYTVGSSDAAATTQQQEQQQQAEHQPAEQYAGNGYGYDDDGAGGPQQSYHYASGPGGSRIDPDTLSYLTEVCEALAGMSDPEEASLLRANVLEEVAGKELSLATDAASASLLEQLLGGAPASQLIQFMSAFTDGDLLWRCAGAAFGSHVSEKVLAWLHAAAAAAAAAAADEDGSSSSIEGLEPLLESLVAAVEPHMVDYATDKHATHVARALLVVVTGRDVLTPPGKKQRQRQQQQGGGGEGEEGQPAGAQQQHQQQAQHKGVFGKQRSSLAEKMQSSAVSPSIAAVRFPVLLRRLVKALPLFDPQQMSALGKNTYGGPLLQAMLRAAAQDEALLMLMLPPVLGLDPSKAAAAAPGQRLATLTDSHVGRLLRDDCYSHLLEVAVAVMPQQAVAAAAEDEAGAAAAGGDEQEGHSKKKKKRKLDAAAGEQEEEDEQTPAAAAGGSGKGVSLADEFYERFLKGRLLPLCCHHCANFVIQAVLAATSNRARVAAYVAELAPHLPDLMRRRRSGVVAALAAAAARAGPGPHQQVLVDALANALGQQAQWQGRTGTAHLAPALMALDTQAVFGSASGSSGSSTRLSTPGCAMLALLLSQFRPNVVAPFWDSMGALPQGDVVRVAKDPSGSRVLEAVLAVPAAQEGGLSKRKLRKLKKQKQHQADGDNPAAAATAADGAHGGGEEDTAAVAARGVLLEKLRGSWGVLVQTPSGSFLLEAVYNNTTPEQAEALVAEVAAVSDQLMSRCSWGALVARKLGLEAYQRSPEEWRKRAAAAATARKVFQQLLSTTAGSKRGKAQPAAAAAAAVGAADGAQGDQQQQKPGKKKRRREEAAAVAAAGHETVAGDAAAAAGEEDAAVSNAKKRARLAAAALAAAEAADTAERAEEERQQQQQQQQQQRKKQKKRKLSQPDAAAAAGEVPAQPPKKKSKNDKQQVESAGSGKSKKKRGMDSAGSGAAATAAGGGDVDLVALLGFGGLSADKQHSSKKHKN